MALFQASRRVLAPVRSSVARSFTSLGPRDMQQSVQMTPTLGLGFSKQQSKLGLPQDQAIQDIQDHWKLSQGVQSKVPVEKNTLPMAMVDSLTSLPNDLQITFSTVADLEKYVDLSKSEGSHSPDEVHKLFQHFVMTSGVKGPVCLDVATMTFNYGDTIVNAPLAKKVTVGEARAQKQALPGGNFAKQVYAEKLFSSLGGGSVARKMDGGKLFSSLGGNFARQ